MAQPIVAKEIASDQSSAPSAPVENGSVAQKKDKPAKPKQDKKLPKDGASEYPLELSPPPIYIQHRIEVFEKLKKEYDESVKSKPRENILVTLPTGDTKSAIAWETTPMDIAKSLAKSLAERAVIAKVNGELWDLERPFEKASTLEILDFENDEAKRVYWHSSAHILGEACERHYGCNLCIGPPVDDGFYYEMGMADERTVASGDYQPLETLVKSIMKDKQPFERVVITKEGLLEMFKHNPFKQHIIKDKIPDGESTTVYRCGPLIDLCRGPHVPHTGRIKSFAILKNSSSYFLGDAKNASLQRIYGISFPDKKLMDEHKKFLEEAAKRDHRKIGIQQDLFFFNDLSPGSCFFTPRGARIYNTLLDLMKAEYRKRGYDEVISPNMFNSKLWQISGHWANYSEDMFIFDVDKEKFGLKPMNCPGHCLIFKHRARSHRELPLRMADFGVLHRNEASGALAGLTRVRRFQQDDAHIFCMPEQIESEVAGVFDFLSAIYGIFGYSFKMELSTRPEKYLGEIETWNKAEKMLENALDKFAPGKWELNPGDGAFYGPKIDITLTDALRRNHQCATIQLDFQLPERFELEYDAPIKGEKPDRPVMIHRAILGSLERCIAILTEHFAGKWPFWLSPRQVVVIPVDPKFAPYATEVAKLLDSQGLYADADLSGDTLNKKIRNGEVNQYNFIFVVGEVETNEKSVNIRSRDDVGTKQKGDTMPLQDALERLLRLKQERRLDCRLV